jgi:hypothetical protein
MSQLEPTLGPALDLSLEAPSRRAPRRFHIPGWFVLLLSNPKSRLGFLGRLPDDHRLIAPWISVAHPLDFNILATARRLLEPPLRHDRPGATFLAGRHQRAAVAAASAWRLPPSPPSRRPSASQRRSWAARRRHHQLPDQRLSRDSADPASRRHVRLHAGTTA